MTINVRPLGYSTTISDVLQNISLIKEKKHNLINKFIFKNLFLKHGGKTFIPELDYDYLIIEVCSIKKIINNNTGFIIPYEIEGRNPINYTYKIVNEEFNETIDKIKNLQKLLNCKIILIPPIYIFNGNPIKGVHETVIPSKVINYRLNILERLKKAENNESILLYDWNENIKENGINKMLKDQFHFTDFGKKYNLEKIINLIEKKTYYSYFR